MTTIDTAERMIENALLSLPANSNLANAAEVLKFLAPSGYVPVVEIEDDGRHERRDALAQNWDPETGELRIYFVRNAPDSVGMQSTGDNFRAANAEAGTQSSTAPNHRFGTPSFAVASSAMRPEIEGESLIAAQRELCAALEEVEREGWAFVSLKRFRDDVLTKKGFAWAIDPDERQSVLTSTIENGLVLTGRIANPRSPYPTTTIRLNSAQKDTGSASRYTPRTIRGRGLSDTILEERGPR